MQENVLQIFDLFRFCCTFSQCRTQLEEEYSGISPKQRKLCKICSKIFPSLGRCYPGNVIVSYLIWAYILAYFPSEIWKFWKFFENLLKDVISIQLLFNFEHHQLSGLVGPLRREQLAKLPLSESDSPKNFLQASNKYHFL